MSNSEKDERSLIFLLGGELASPGEDGGGSGLARRMLADVEPGDCYAWFKRGREYFEEGNIGQAIRAFSESIKLKPSYIKALVWRGRAYARRIEDDKAIRDCSAAIRHARKHFVFLRSLKKRLLDEVAEAYLVRGTIYLVNDTSKAVMDFNEVIHRLPDSYRGYFGRGHEYEYKGEYDQAIKDYSEAIRLQPDSASAFRNRGDAYGKKGDYVQAIKDYSQALNLKPDEEFVVAACYIKRGNAYRDKGDYDQAIIDYSKVIRLKPGRGDAWYARGNVYNNKAYYRQAVRDFSEAIRLGNDGASIRKFRAHAHRNLGNTTEADADFKKAQEFEEEAS